MSTRSIIARTGGEHRDSFHGRYHHSDGYASGVGATLYQLYNGFFEKDLERMLKVLLDDHPAGWSNINGCDWGMEPGWYDMDRSNGQTWEEYYNSPAYRRPKCYCHGERHEEASEFTSDMPPSWCEWAYAINPKTHKMFVHKCTGVIQVNGEERDKWTLVEEVDLDGPAPDWAKMDTFGYEEEETEEENQS